MSSIDEQNRQKNADVKQNQAKEIKEQQSYFNNLGLTKRNAEYMIRFHRQFESVKLDADKKNDIIDKMVNELLAHQKEGKTARNMYGTVEERINSIVNPPKQKQSITANYWPNAVYNAIFFFAMFNAIYGITFLFNYNKGAQNQNAAGFTTLLIISVAAGLGTPIITRLFDANIVHTYSGWMRFLFMLLMVVGWILIFIVTAFLPAIVNPLLNPIADLVIAGVGILFNLYLKSKYPNITGMFAMRR